MNHRQTSKKAQNLRKEAHTPPCQSITWDDEQASSVTAPGPELQRLHVYGDCLPECAEIGAAAGTRPKLDTG